jgi:hypothetical protein
MMIQRDQPPSRGVAASAVLAGVLLLTVAGTAMVYRLSASGSPSRATPGSARSAEPVFFSSAPPRTVETADSVTIRAAAPGPPPRAASPTKPETENAGMNRPFVEARREPRDSVWALEMESGVRDALAALRDKEVVLQNVQCASIRCTLEGTIGRRGTLQDVVSALSEAGLTRGRFKRVRGADGTTTFSGVLARHGYKLDGAPKEDAAKAL